MLQKQIAAIHTLLSHSTLLACSTAPMPEEAERLRFLASDWATRLWHHFEQVEMPHYAPDKLAFYQQIIAPLKELYSHFEMLAKQGGISSGINHALADATATAQLFLEEHDAILQFFRHEREESLRLLSHILDVVEDQYA